MNKLININKYIHISCTRYFTYTKKYVRYDNIEWIHFSKKIDLLLIKLL